MRRSLGLLLLLVILSSCGKKSAPPARDRARAPVEKPQAGKEYATVEIDGAFSARGSQDINLLSPNTMGPGPKEPPPLPVSDAQLAVLNRELPAAVDEIVKELGFTRAPKDAPQGDKMRKLVREPDGDQFFAISVEPSGQNGLGGHYGGLDVVTRLRSLQRDEDLDLHGWDKETVTLGTPEELPRNLRTALRVALTESRKDLKATLHLPVGEVELAFDVTRLSAAERVSVADKIAPCAARIANPVDHQRGVVSDTRVTRRIWFRVRNADETEEAWLQWFEQALPQLERAELKFRYGCLREGPLVGRAASVRRKGHTLTVSFVDKKP